MMTKREQISLKKIKVSWMNSNNNTRNNNNNHNNHKNYNTEK